MFFNVQIYYGLESEKILVSHSKVLQAIKPENIFYPLEYLMSVNVIKIFIIPFIFKTYF